MMSIIDWLTEPAFVSREVNWLYFIIVTIISLVVLSYALYTKNRRAIYLYIFGIFVWVAIEGGSMLLGLRTYESSSVPLAFFVVAVMEDPGWVCLAYIVAEKGFKRFFKK
ncbi:MAG: hypothetical protein KAJ51_15700 [Thermoplasmata archaeon]|nr:hypothetical protein [Thermoplasmata archaeon]